MVNYQLLTECFLSYAIPEIVNRVVAEKVVSYCPHEPFDKQKYFLEYLGLEALYGGAAGGGKSDALLMAALQYVHVPNYSAILFRKTYADLSLPQAIMSRLSQWLVNTPAKWSDKTKTWKFPSGATVSFGYIDSPNDIYRYQSAEFQYIGFDELTQFTEMQYTYLFSRLRKTVDNEVPLRMRAASNPGGIGHEWVKARFIDVEPTDSRRFYPSTFFDNPFIEKTSYEMNLRQTDEVTQAQLIEGNWEAKDPGLLDFATIVACEAKTLWVEGIGENPRPQLYMGVDIGRTNDRTVIWTWELVEDTLWAREILELSNVSFANQKHEITTRLANGRYVACRIDRGGIGMQLAEELETKYPYLVEGIQLSGGVMGKVASMFATAMRDRKIRIPESNVIREDFRQVKKVNTSELGVPTIKTVKGHYGHADRFWAAALGRLGVGSLERKQVNAGLAKGFTYNRSR